MSYRCEKCGAQVGVGISQKKIVVKTQPVIHLDTFLDENGREQHRRTPGTQIIQEMAVCLPCYEIHQKG
jgi:hypothetical protein